MLQKRRIEYLFRMQEEESENRNFSVAAPQCDTAYRNVGSSQRTCERLVTMESLTIVGGS